MAIRARTPPSAIFPGFRRSWTPRGTRPTAFISAGLQHRRAVCRHTGTVPAGFAPSRQVSDFRPSVKRRNIVQ